MISLVHHRGFPGLYSGLECAFIAAENRDHVFEPDGGYEICECGFKKRVKCVCADCDLRHVKIVDTVDAERVSHELFRLHRRLDALTRPTITITPAGESETTQ